MNRLRLLIIPLLILSSIYIKAQAPLIITNSPYPVEKTIKRLKEAIEQRNLTVITVIDHAQGAKEVDMDLHPMQLIIFGNPRMDAMFMQSDPNFGIELPLKFLVKENEEGKTQILFKDFKTLAEPYDLEEHQAKFEMLNNSLKDIANIAVKQE